MTAVDPTNNQVIGHLDAGGVLNSDADTWACASDNQHLIKVDPATRRVRDVLAVDLGAHRRLPVDRDDDVKPVTPAPVPAMQRVGDGRLAWREAWDRRRADLAELGGVADELTAVDRRVDDLNRRAAALLADHADVVLE